MKSLFRSLKTPEVLHNIKAKPVPKKKFPVAKKSAPKTKAVNVADPKANKNRNAKGGVGASPKAKARPKAIEMQNTAKIKSESKANFVPSTGKSQLEVKVMDKSDCTTVCKPAVMGACANKGGRCEKNDWLASSNPVPNWHIFYFRCSFSFHCSAEKECFCKITSVCGETNGNNKPDKEEAEAEARDR